jgi:hypothetical protein
MALLYVVKPEVKKKIIPIKKIPQLAIAE